MASLTLLSFLFALNVIESCQYIRFNTQLLPINQCSYAINGPNNALSGKFVCSEYGNYATLIIFDNNMCNGTVLYSKNITNTKLFNCNSNTDCGSVLMRQKYMDNSTINCDTDMGIGVDNVITDTIPYVSGCVTYKQGSILQTCNNDSKLMYVYSDHECQGNIIKERVLDRFECSNNERISTSICNSNRNNIATFDNINNPYITESIPKYGAALSELFPNIFDQRTYIPTINPSLTPTIAPSYEPTMEPFVYDDEFIPPRKKSRIKQLFLGTPALVFHTIIQIIITLLFISLLCHLYCCKSSRNKTNQMSSKFNIPAILTVFFNFIGVLGLLMVCSILENQWLKWHFTSYNESGIILISYSMAATGYALGKLGVQVFLLMRLHVSFNRAHSLFKVPLSVIVSLLIFMIVTAIAWIFGLIWRGQIQSDLTNTDSKVYAFILSSECIITIILTYLFVSRLTKLIMQHKTTMKHEVSHIVSCHNVSGSYNGSPLSGLSPTHVPQFSEDPTITSGNPNEPQLVKDNSMKPRHALQESGGSVDMTFASDFINHVRQETMHKVSETFNVKYIKNQISKERHRKLIFVITRLLVLSLFAMLTTNMFVLFIFIVNNLLTNVDSKISIYWLYIVWSIDMLINSLCLYLNFYFTTYSYKVCCMLCHNSCQYFVQHCIAKRIYSSVYKDIIESGIDKHMCNINVNQLQSDFYDHSKSKSNNIVLNVVNDNICCDNNDTKNDDTSTELTTNNHDINNDTTNDVTNDVELQLTSMKSKTLDDIMFTKHIKSIPL